GCPPDQGLCTDRGANPFTPEGVLVDADREGIETMVFFPNVAVALPSIEDFGFGAEFARLYNRWLASYCRPHGGRLRGVAVVPIEDVATSIEIMREARTLGLVATIVPAALKVRNLDPPDLEPLHAAAAELDRTPCAHGAPAT